MLRLMQQESPPVYEVRCRSCGRLIGMSPSKAYIFCPLPTCAIEPEPTYDNEERDSIIVGLSISGFTDSEIAGVFDITRARVQQIASSRPLPHYEKHK